MSPSRFAASLSLLLGLVLPGAEAAPPPEFDLLITGARIYDGTGKPPVEGSIAIRAGRIAALGAVTGPARESLHAAGLAAAPGFIDVHTHSEDICQLPLAENFLRMGVTTIVTGNCGNSRTDVAQFFGEIQSAGTTLHVATLIGHNSVRRQAMGGNFIRPPRPDELAAMEALVDQALQEGALGLSTGLIYVPGTYASTAEIVALAKVAASHGGIYVSHMRHETVRIFEALEEFIHIARAANIRAQVSHIKLSGPSAWGQAARVLHVLDEARASGLAITHDQYAYTASSTGLRQTIPDAALAGTREDFLARLADPEEKEKIRQGMAEILARAGRTDYAYAVIARFRDDPSLTGLPIPEAARLLRGSDRLEDQVELILDIEARGGASAIYHGMHEDDLVAFLRHPLTMIASDGGPRRFGQDIPHPRSYGNNARVLARYVREKGLFPLEEAIRRMTSLPAQTFALSGRGLLAPGAWADLVLFDPELVADPATFADPHHYAEGFPHVFIDGVPVILEGKLTGQLPGGPLRRG